MLTDEELKPHVKSAMLRVAYEWHKNDLQRIKDALLARKEIAVDPSDPKYGARSPSGAC